MALVCKSSFGQELDDGATLAITFKTFVLKEGLMEGKIGGMQVLDVDKHRKELRNKLGFKANIYVSTDVIILEIRTTRRLDSALHLETGVQHAMGWVPQLNGQRNWTLEKTDDTEMILVYILGMLKNSRASVHRNVHRPQVFELCKQALRMLPDCHGYIRMR